MNYRIMWKLLRQDMTYFKKYPLTSQFIPGIDLCLSDMKFIEGIEKLEEPESPVGYVEK